MRRLLILLAACSWSVYFAIQKHYAHRYSPLTMACYMVWAGTLMLCINLPGLPAAVAAKVACPDRTVVCFAGDGDFQMNCQELGTAMQAGAQMIKLEGGGWTPETVHFLTDRGIPICAHLGLTPQTVHALGGYRVQGRDADSAAVLRRQAKELADAGAAMMVLELMPTEVAAAVHLSPAHLQRVFAEWAGISPKRFLQYLTKEYARQRLAQSASLLDVTLAAGLGSPSRLHELMVSCEAMTPGEIKAAARGIDIGHGVAPTPFGDALVAWTARGVCHFAFCRADDAALLAELRSLWPAATLDRDDAHAHALMQQIFARTPTRGSVHLVLRGTNDASWDIDLAAGAFHLSPRWWQMLGLAPDEDNSDTTLWAKRLHPDDSARVQALLQELLADGKEAALWGLLPGHVTMQKRLAALGPQQLAVAGHTLRGHTFHYSTSDSSAPVVARTARPNEVVAPDAGEALYRQGSIHASYFHAWFPSSPEAVAHLLGGASV